MEERLTELETKVMFQDQTIEDLNQVIYDQQQQLDKLSNEINFLKKQFLTLAQTQKDDLTPAP